MTACQVCGWAAAACSILTMGSFGVPIKSEAARSVDIDPLVFQTYKTFVCFATSWLILLTGETFTFSPWGIVSGLFWVPGGTATAYAIKTAGLSIGVSISSSCIILSSFTWGIFVFQEKVHSKAGASFAVVCLILGLLGMSYHSSPKSKVALLRSSSFSSLEMSPPKVKVDRERSRSQTPTRTESFGDLHVSSSSGYGTVLPIRSRIKAGESMSNSLNDDSLHSANDDEILVLRGDDKSSAVAPIDATGGSQNVNFLGRKLPKRTYGIILAGAFGLWGGSIMVPMKLAPSNVQGAHFLLSFSIGSSIVTLLFWAVRYLYYVYQYQSLSEAYDVLPSFHLRVMWVAGGTSGLLWSIGNFFNLITVFYLGQGVGYPVVQSSMLVSGLWGIFYFKEVQGFKRISMWILSSLVTIYGIVLISYEHVDN